jgi:hypothetical protein
MHEHTACAAVCRLDIIGAVAHVREGKVVSPMFRDELGNQRGKGRFLTRDCLVCGKARIRARRFAIVATAPFDGAIRAKALFDCETMEGSPRPWGRVVVRINSDRRIERATHGAVSDLRARHHLRLPKAEGPLEPLEMVTLRA